MDALILCGGQASRLGKLAEARPKVLMNVNGRPFLEYLFEFYGPWAERFVLLAGHLGEQLRPYACSNIDVVVEQTRLDTGGAILSVLDGVSDRFIVANGDTLFVGLDMEAFVGAAVEVPATAAVLRAPTAGRGHVEISGRRGVRFREKEGPSEGWVYAGLALFERTVLSDFARGTASLERLVLPRLAERGQLNVWRFAGQLFDIGTPQGLEAFRHVSQDETTHGRCPQKLPGDGRVG